MEDAPPSTMRRDIVSAYVAALARVGSVAIISAILLRKTNERYFAVFVVVRAVVGLLNYAFAGVAPALQRSLAMSHASIRDNATESNILSYATRGRSAEAVIYGNALLIGGFASLFCWGMIWVFSESFVSMHGQMITRHWLLPSFVFWFATGQLFRVMSDIPGAALQVKGHITLDNGLVALAELGWALAAMASISHRYADTFYFVGTWYVISGGGLWIFRLIAMRIFGPRVWFADLPPTPNVLQELLSFGFLVVLGQVADFLYAPVATLLAQHFIGPRAVADYAPALQFDAALLLATGAIAAVLLPKTAAAASHREFALVRRYYIRGTIASGLILLFLSVIVVSLSRIIFMLWLGQPMDATRAILPLIFIHTVVGGSSAVGRSILLGMGKVKPFTISVLIAGISNVILSYVFVRYFGLGLRGIVLGTIIAVVVRAGIWMPWYVLRTLRFESLRSS